MALLHPVLAHLEDASAAATTCFDLLAVCGGTLLYRDGQALDACEADPALVPMVYAALWMVALKAYPFFLNIHAGVIGTPAGCVLLPAPPGSGKSTLTASLVRAGYEYFSDEVALLDVADLSVVPFPQAFCIKETGLAATAKIFPEAAALKLHLRGDGKRVAYLPPPAESLPGPGDRRPVHALAFPRYEPGARLSCRPLSKTAALGRMLDQCTVVDRRLDVAAVQRLLAWIDGVVCCDLTYGVTADGVAGVTTLVSEAWRSIHWTRHIQTAK